MTAKKTHRIPLTRKQQKKVQRIYLAEREKAGVEIGALIGQPTTDYDFNQPPEDRGQLVIRFFTPAEVKGMAAGYKSARKESQTSAALSEDDE